MPDLVLGIDASNLRAGGGVTHLTALLGAADARDHGFSRVIVWGGRKTLDRLPRSPWLELVAEPMLDRSLVSRAAWQQVRLPLLARNSCSVLLAPGGTAPSGFRPRVVMCRNMLPFEPAESARFGNSWTRVRHRLLALAQLRSFATADGVIFLTEYARQAVSRLLPSQPRSFAVIPHGVDDRFRAAPRPQRRRDELSPQAPLRLLYVSIVSPYKHQHAVARAVAILRRRGIPLSMEFVGGSDSPSAAKTFRDLLLRLDPNGEFLRYAGESRHGDLPRQYRAADGFVFASSCENMPNILIEAMASGLPIACARRGPMPEVLDGAGEYFDPEVPESIAEALQRLIDSPKRRADAARDAFQKAAGYSWVKCATETYGFVSKIADDNPRGTTRRFPRRK